MQTSGKIYQMFIEREIDNYSTVLDLMSSWDSYLPQGKNIKRLLDMV